MPVVGLIGFGTIAGQLHAAMAGRGLRWVALRRREGPLPPDVEAAADLAALMAARPAVVVEAAGQAAVAAHVPELLRQGHKVVLASTGALADPTLAQQVWLAALTPGARLILPSGAIGGLDYLRAVADLPGLAIRYTSRKPVAAWAAELAALGQDGRAEVVLFEGPAAAAAQAYPKNLNVALTLALAAPRAALTVRVVADPAAAGNLHEIEVQSPAGRAEFRLLNAPAPGNPKTSLVTALSLRQALEEALA